MRYPDRILSGIDTYDECWHAGIMAYETFRQVINIVGPNNLDGYVQVSLTFDPQMFNTELRLDLLRLELNNAVARIFGGLPKAPTALCSEDQR